ncbi:MAG TPA: glycosyltransferase family 39 protein [Ramlibacter sp.]|nr:glycosyltransferase family 39 protein [Ramlibacter sp.]
MRNWPAARRFETIAMAGILVLALALRLWGLEQNGWGADYYSAAVRSMALGWHNFFYAAFDPEGFLSVDKPPIALWLQVAGVKLLGLRPLGVLLPQVLEGVLSVWVLFRIVRRRFSAMAALLAALFFAVTPILVAVNRTNNMDSCLLLALLLATWAFMKAAEEGSRRWLLISLAAIGIAFNIKMLAAFIVLPAIFIIYLIGAPKRWPQRLADLSLATLVLAATALPWVLVYEWTPAASRPWVGGSTGNSMLELLVGANGMQRFVSRLKQPAVAANPQSAPAAPNTAAAGQRSRNIASRLFVHAPTGPLRLADGQLAAQVAWLLPLSVAALAIGAWQSRLRRPLSPEHLALLFWFVWLLTYAAVYSSAGGTMHFYYLSTLAPALAALAGVGVARLWAWHGQGGRRAWALPSVLALTAVWQLRIQADALGWTLAEMQRPPMEWVSVLHMALAGASLVAALALVLVPMLRSGPGGERRAWAAGALGLGVVALLAVPMAWTLSSVLRPGHGVLPSADLYRLAPGPAGSEPARAWFGRAADTSRLVALLRAKRSSERFLLATTTTHLADAIILSTGEAVMARGGYHGLDRAISAERFAQGVQAGEVRFAMVGDAPTVSRMLGADAAGKTVDDWIRANGTPVAARRWRGRGMPAGAELYDLYPEPGFVN